MDLATRVKHVPTQPGVYFFRDKNGTILYIGKAKNLRNRVRSYFQKNKYQSPKNISLIKRIDNVEWVVVASEVEALLTEANLIKKHRPKYNIDLKDDKSYPFIRITKEPFPQVLLTRQVVHDGSKYFGPFTDVNRLRYTLKVLHQVFQIRTCTYYLDDGVIAAKKVALCLDYHIKKCGGPCEGLVSAEEYGAMVKRVIQFLHGDTRETETYLQAEMQRAAEEFRFEDAAYLRDQWLAVKRFKERQRKAVADFGDRDVFALAQEDELGIVVVIRIRNGRIFSREKIALRNVTEEPGPIFDSVITRFYLDGDFIPEEITVQHDPASYDELNVWLREKRGKKVNLHRPRVGEKAREVRLAYQNAKLLLGEWILERKKRKEYIPRLVQQLQEDLQLKVPPRRIEAFDVSHLGGTNTVASMVCFVDGKPRKSEYRKYNIRQTVGIDDYAAIREVVYRRYRRLKEENQALPDLILIDGGKGQLSMAVSALEALELTYLPVVGLAKRLEEVYLPGQSAPQMIPRQSPGLILLRKIRDEAHRFAITFQRHKRVKDVTASIFQSIPGMGPQRIKKLLANYPNVKTIAQESQEALISRTGIPRKIVRQVQKVAEQFINQQKS